MSEGSFTLEVEQLDDYEFRVRFDQPDMPDLQLDEPPPLGGGQGPNASRLLAAAVANCLSASLLFCLRKAHLAPARVRARATTEMVRNAAQRLRVGSIGVEIDVDGLDDADRASRCAALFEEFCVVTASIRQGIPVEVAVRADGRTLGGEA